MQSKLSKVVFQQYFDNNNSSSLHLTISSMYTFRYSSLPITAPKCLCPDDVIFVLVLSNISAAFYSYSGLTINIVLPYFGKYPYFGPTYNRTFHQRCNVDNLPCAGQIISKSYHFRVSFRITSRLVFQEYC